jgi:hypothetical protein
MNKTKKQGNHDLENHDKLKCQEEKFYDRVAQCELRLRHLEMHEHSAKDLPEEHKNSARLPYLHDLKNLMEKLKNHLTEYCKQLDLKIRKTKNKKEKNKLLKAKSKAKKKTEELSAKIKKING